MNEIELLEQERARLTTLIEALAILVQSKEWNVVREMVFEKSLEAIKRQILIESLAKEIDTAKLYKLQGEYAWSKQYADTDRFIEGLKKMLENINSKLKTE